MTMETPIQSTPDDFSPFRVAFLDLPRGPWRRALGLFVPQLVDAVTCNSAISSCEEGHLAAGCEEDGLPPKLLVLS